MSDEVLIQGGLYDPSPMEISSDTGRGPIVDIGVTRAVNTSPSQSIADALGIDVPAPPAVDPEVDSFLKGKSPTVEKAQGQSDIDALVRELREQNNNLKAALGRQGNEVVGPQRQKINQLEAQLAELQRLVQQGGSAQGIPQKAPSIDDIISELYPNADPRDETVRQAALAHMTAARQVGELVRNAMSSQETKYAQLQAKLQEVSFQTALAGLDRAVVARLTEKYPLLTDPRVPFEERVSMLRDLASAETARKSVSRQPNGTVFLDPGTHVEGSVAAGLDAQTDQGARLKDFDRMTSGQQGSALARMFAGF